MDKISIPSQWIRVPVVDPELEGYRKGHFTVVVSQDDRWRHVSVSSMKGKPPLDKLIKIRRAFFAPGAVITQECPYPDEPLNTIDPNCVHLWQRLEADPTN